MLINKRNSKKLMKMGLTKKSLYPSKNIHDKDE